MMAQIPEFERERVKAGMADAKQGAAQHTLRPH
jgi:hypothetical protein